MKDFKDEMKEFKGEMIVFRDGIEKKIAELKNTQTELEKTNYLDDFLQSLPEFFDFFPELKGKKLIPIFSSLRFTPQQLAILTMHKIYGMSMSGSTMELLNFEAIPFA